MRLDRCTQKDDGLHRRASATVPRETEYRPASQPGLR